MCFRLPGGNGEHEIVQVISIDTIATIHSSGGVLILVAEFPKIQTSLRSSPNTKHDSGKFPVRIWLLGDVERIVI